MVVVGAAYAYELRQGDQVLSTGRLTMDDELAPGDEVTVAGIVALVNELAWVGGESRLLLEPVHAPSRGHTQLAHTLSRADRPKRGERKLERSGGHFVRRDGAHPSQGRPLALRRPRGSSGSCAAPKLGDRLLDRLRRSVRAG